MHLIEMPDYNRYARAYWWITTLAGGLVFSYTALAVLHLDTHGLIGVIELTAAVCIAGMCSIRIPGTQTVITPSDVFVLLSAILLGPAAATVVAVFDAFAVSWRNSKRWTSRFGGPALTGISIFMSAWLFHWIIAWRGGFALVDTTTFFVALLIFAMLHFAVNSLLLTTLQALKERASVGQLWLKNYLWTGLTYAGSASAAGLLYLAIGQQAFVALFVASPIVAVIFSTCYFYGKRNEAQTRAERQRLEAAAQQARQSELHLRELEQSEERFHSAFTHAPIGMALVAQDGRWLQANHTLCGIMGYSEDEMRATDFQTLSHPDDIELVYCHVARLLSDSAPLSPVETRYINKLGETVWVSLSVSMVRDAQSGFPCFIFQIQDNTAKKRDEERLAHALRDSLTDLPSRALFMDRLTLAMARTERHPDRMFGVLFLDLDRFKTVNDSLGHAVGDQLLVAIARRLEGCVRATDTLARLGGDEFTILLDDLDSPRQAVELSERIQETLAVPFSIGEHEVLVSSSIGIAPMSSYYQTADEILRDADTAMYRAKALGRARCVLFDREMHARAARRLKLETDLRRAVEREEFFVVYHPIVCLKTGRLVGFEALARWQNADSHFHNPAEFIPIAEEIGFMVRIGQSILEKTCRQLRQWQLASDDFRLTASVNLSAKQLLKEDLLEQIGEVLRRTGVNPHYLRVELTETVIMENIEAATRVLKQLHARGIQLSIDDFGTGYSSLSFLRRLPIDSFKIDRSFVSQMARDEDNAEIVRTIINLARSLKKVVIAEGVETPAQLESLRRMGCDQGQGYLFSEPLSAEAAGHLAAQYLNWRAFGPAELDSQLSQTVDSMTAGPHE